MGMDLVEIVMEVEDEFGIVLPDEEVQHVETVGQLYQCVMRKINGRRPIPCPGVVAFGRLRRAVIDAGVALRQDVRLDTDLAALFAPVPQAWEFALRSLGMRLTAPPLPPQRRKVLQVTATICFAAAVILAIWIVATRSINPPLILSAVATFTLFITLSSRLANRPPDDCATVRGFLQRYQSALAPQPASDAWERVVRIVCRFGGADPASVRPQTHLVHDLGLS